MGAALQIRAKRRAKPSYLGKWPDEWGKAHKEEKKMEKEKASRFEGTGLRKGLESAWFRSVGLSRVCTEKKSVRESDASAQEGSEKWVVKSVSVCVTLCSGLGARASMAASVPFGVNRSPHAKSDSSRVEEM